MPLPKCYLLFVLFRFLEKKSKERKEQLRDVLLGVLREKNILTETVPELGTFSVTYPKSKSLDAAAVIRLLQDRQIDPAKGVQTVVTSTQVVDMVGLDNLVNSGHLTQEEVEKCRPALEARVTAKESGALAAFLDRCK